MSDIINNVMASTWPIIIVSSVIISTIRLTYLYINKIHFTFYKELVYLMAIIYILALFQIVTREDVVSWSTNNFIPLKEIFRYKIGSKLFLKNVIGNILLFIPYGFLISYYLKQEKFKLPVILTFVASLTIECVQMAIGRVFDVDDIILNTVGGFIGFQLYNSYSIITKNIPRVFKSEIFLNLITIVLLLGLLAFLCYN